MCSLLLLASLPLTQPCRGGLVGFEETGRLNQARAAHTATLLPNGKVLVTGGPGSSAELYDPASRTWAVTGSMSTVRSEHTATLLSSGKVLVVGGSILFTTLASAELYDPATGTWTATGSLNRARREHTATLLPDGKVLVAGGFFDMPGTTTGGNSLATAEIYDPASGTWTLTGSLATPRRGHSATLLPNGRVLVAGGNDWFHAGILRSAEMYDPATGTWTETVSMAYPRGGPRATLLLSGKVLVLGNDTDAGPFTSELYDPANGTWTTTGNLAHRSYGSATLLPGGRVLVTGGYIAGAYSSAELYDPVSGSWTTTGSLNTQRFRQTATLLPDGTVLVAGGWPGEGTNNPTASAELYGKPMPTLLNISTRMNVQTGDKALIAGFIIAGSAQKTVLVRGMGPSLPLGGTLADPVIEVHGPAGELLATNDNWNDAATRQQISDSGLAPGHAEESALWGIINPGAYTVILSGKGGGTGVGSVEVYDLDEPADSRLANISTRGFVDTGNNVMIGGLIVGGGSAPGVTRVFVRALGPSIKVPGALTNPTVELHDENGSTIAFNDDWKTRSDGSSQQAEIEATTIPPSNDQESALVQTLQPGSYTAIVRGKSNGTGIGLLEFYHLP
jgi:Kelch motif/Galactose oxidase, central domain